MERKRIVYKMKRKFSIATLTEKPILLLTNYVREILAPKVSIALHVNRRYADGKIEKDVVYFKNVIDITGKIKHLFNYLKDEAKLISEDFAKELVKKLENGEVRAYKTIYNYTYLLMMCLSMWLIIWLYTRKPFYMWVNNLLAIVLYVVFLLSTFKSFYQKMHYIIVIDPHDDIVYNEYTLKPRIWSIKEYHVFIPSQVRVKDGIENFINSLTMSIEEASRVVHVLDYLITKMVVLKAKNYMLEKELEEMKRVSDHAMKIAEDVTSRAVSSLTQMKDLLINKEMSDITKLMKTGPSIDWGKLAKWIVITLVIVLAFQLILKFLPR